MSVLALFAPLSLPVRDRPAPAPRAKADWPLIGDVATCRAGVPEALITGAAHGAKTRPTHKSKACRAKLGTGFAPFAMQSQKPRAGQFNPA